MNQSFDKQAKDFDQRTGLPDTACRSIADAVLEAGKEQANAPAIHMIEVGAGTGQIGQHFFRQGVVYKGIDSSSEMLEIFRTRLADQSYQPCDRFELTHGDADQQWQVDSSTVDLVFSSRAVHLFDAKHFCEELCRVARPKGIVFVAGRRKRDTESIAAQMRKKMRHLLSKRGIEGRNGQNHMATLIQMLSPLATFGTPISKTVSDWTTSRSPIESIRSWQQKEGLAGIDVAPATKQSVLQELENWAKLEFDDIAARFHVNESYVLDLLRICPHHGRP